MHAPIFLISVVFFTSPMFSDAQSDCQFNEPNVKCDYYSGDHVALDRMLHNGTLKETVYINEYDSEATPTGRRVNVADIAPSAKKLTLTYHWPSGMRNNTLTMTIRPGTLAKWTNLEWFSAQSRVEQQRVIVDVAADEFSGSFSKLTRIELSNVSASENTLRATASVSHQLEDFSSSFSEPENEIISLVSNMTNLKRIKLLSRENRNLFESSTVLRNSASTLKIVQLYYCGLTMVKREMLRGMGNLTLLEISDNQTQSVEEGAFDDLINVEYISLFLYSIRRLPHGLFDKLTKLYRVSCYVGRYGNLSRANFTHVEDFENFGFTAHPPYPH